MTYDEFKEQVRSFLLDDVDAGDISFSENKGGFESSTQMSRVNFTITWSEAYDWSVEDSNGFFGEGETLEDAWTKYAD